MKLHLLALALGALAGGESTFTPSRPPAIPLAVKSPYMSTWLQVGSSHAGGGSGGYLAGSWPSVCPVRSYLQHKC